MLDYNVKIALIPLRRNVPGKRTGVFNQDVARSIKDDVISYIRQNFANPKVTFTDLEGLNDEGLLFDQADCFRLAEELKSQKVDAIFLINCNFGNEEAAGLLARLVGKPVLIWAVRDTDFLPDGNRHTDAQCGFFAISRILQHLNQPFSYIENCHLRDNEFREGLLRFISVTCMVKNFFNLRILQIGSRPTTFKSVMINEAELMEKFGIDITIINMAIFTREFNRIMAEKDFSSDLAALKSTFDIGSYPDSTLVRMLTFREVYRYFMTLYNCRIAVSDCWSATVAAVGALPCTAMSLLADENLIVTCETDIMGSLTMAMLSCAALGEKIPFFGEFISRHPQNDHAELIWHCGPFAASLSKEKPRLVAEKPSFAVQDGTYTMSRLDSQKGDYFLLSGIFQTTSGPMTIGTYLWAEFEDYLKWEERLTNGPYIHHMAEIEGDYRSVLSEFCKFVPSLAIDPV